MRRAGEAAVTAIVGTALLLAMTMILFTVLNVVVFSFPVHPRSPSASLVASVEYENILDNGAIVVEHNGGDALAENDIQIVVAVGSDAPFIADGIFSSDDELFSIGDRWTYDSVDDLRGESVSITVVHLSTNSILVMGTIQGGDIS